MQFTIAAIAAFAGLAFAASNDTLVTSTVYTTSVHTVISCAATVTNCPAHSTVVVTDTVALYTTICPVTASLGVPKPSSSVSYAQASSTVAPVYVSSSAAASVASSAAATVATATPIAPGATITYTSKAAVAATTVLASGTGAVKPTSTVSSVPIVTGAASANFAPAMGGLVAAAAVAMML